MAAQFSTANLALARPLKRWMVRAANSLPLPVGPVTSTVVFRCATSRTMRYILRIAPLSPTMPGIGSQRHANLLSFPVGVSKASLLGNLQARDPAA